MHTLKDCAYYAGVLLSPGQCFSIREGNIPAHPQTRIRTAQMVLARIYITFFTSVYTSALEYIFKKKFFWYY